MISSEPGVKWIEIDLLMMARALRVLRLFRIEAERLDHLLPLVLIGQRGDEAGVDPVLGVDRLRDHALLAPDDERGVEQRLEVRVLAAPVRPKNSALSANGVSLRPESMPETSSGSSLSALATTAYEPRRILGDHLDAVEPAVHEVAQRLGRLVDDVLPRDQGVGDDVGRRRRRDQHVRLVLARLDRARQIRLPGHRGVDLLGLERGGGQRRLGGEDEVLLDRLLVVGGEARLREQVQEQPVRRRVLRGGDRLALQILDRC